MEPGRLLGHYKIVKLLGKGGMGEVYEALDQRLGRKVALKILPRSLSDNAQRRTRFEREAKTVAALQHPNIVTLHSIEEEDEQLFLVMELVDGKPLAKHIPRQGMALANFFEVAVPLAEAVAAAHKQGITHRDLKPANVLIDTEDRVRVLDFGLAKTAEGMDLAESIGSTESLTEEGRILGTVAYMSPEQAEGKPVDHRSDIFSLGVMLYEMATGERPFQGESGMSVISSILRDDPTSVTEVRSQFPRHLGRIVRRCLQKDPRRRYQTALDLRNDLLELKEELDSGSLEVPAAVAPAKPRWRWVPWALAAVAAVALAVLWLQRDPGDEPAARQEVRRLTTQGTPNSSAISPDGRYVAYESTSLQAHSVRLQQVETGSDIELVSGPAHDFSIGGLRFSGDGNYLYYVSGQSGAAFELHRVPILGGASERLLERVINAAISPDGQWVAAVRADEFNDPWNVLEVVSVEDGALRSRTELEGREFWSVVWDSSSRDLLVEIGSERTEGLFVVSADGGDPVSIPSTIAFSTISDICPDSQGESILVTGRSEGSAHQIWRLDRASGTTSPLSTDFHDYSGCDRSADGALVVTIRHDVRSQLWVVPVDAPETARPVATSSGPRDGADGVAWRDSQTLIYHAPHGEDWQLWQVDLETGSDRVLTTHGAHQPAAAADKVVYGGGWRGERYGVYGFSDDDARLARRLSPPDKITDGNPGLSPDGEWVFFPLLVDTGLRMVRVPWNGGEPIPIYDGSSHLVQFSPDGARFNSHILVDGAYRTGIFAADASTPAKILESHSVVTSPWASDESIYEVRIVEGTMNIFEVSVESGEARQVTDFRSGDIHAFAVSPDLTRLAVARGEVANELLLIENP